MVAQLFLGHNASIGHFPLKELFPDLYHLVRHTHDTVAQCRSSTGWEPSFRRNCNDWEVDRFSSFFFFDEVDGKNVELEAKLAVTEAFERLYVELENKAGDKKLYRLAKARES